MKRLQQSFSTLRRSPSGNAAADSARGSSSVQGTHSASGSNAGISLRQNVEGSQVNIHPREGAPGSPVQRNSASPQSTILASPKETILAVNQQTNVRVNQMYASVLPANVCAVCQELFGPGNIPKIAHCCHSICGKCISILPGHWCPHCAPGIVEKVEATPTNWILLGSIDVANLQQGKPRQCDLCDEESGESVAVVHCSTCNMMICQVHGLAHQKSKDTKQHKLRAFSQLVAELQRLNPSELRIVRNLKQLLCPAHDQRCDTWCAICEEVVCVECVVLNHREHSIYQVNDDVYRTQSQELRTKIVRLQERQEDVKAALTNVSVVIESLNRNAATAESAADFAIDAAIRELENRRANLKSTISDIHAEKRRTLDAQQLYLQKCMVRFQTSVDFGKQLLEQEDQSRVLSIKKFVSTSLSETQRCVDPQMWKPCQDDFIAYRDVGLKTVAEAIACLGHVIGENLRDRAYICKWDSARRGQDVVLVNNDTTAYRVDKMGWGGALGGHVMSMGKYHLALRIENVSKNTFVGIAYTNVNLNEGASRLNIVLRENGEFWVFGEKRGSFTQFKSGDTIHVDVDMDVKQVVFSRDSERICSLSNFDLHKHVDTNMRAFVAFGNSDAIVSLA